MAVLNFPNDPKIGDTYDENGVRYTWEGVQWTARNAGDYVEKSGDNMSGDLTLGIDKIVLDATDGSATFGGNTQIGTWDGTSGVADNGAYIYSAGSYHVNRTNPVGAIWQGHYNGNQTSQILADGSATFAGSVAVANTLGAIDASGISLGSQGIIDIGKSSTETTDYIRGSVSDGAGGFVRKFSLTQDFKLVMGDGLNNSNSNAQITLNAVDGSATFGSSTASISPFNTQSSTLDSNGRVELFKSTNSGLSSFFNGVAQGTTVAQIRDNGSATFGGDLTCRNYLEVTRPVDNSVSVVIGQDDGSQRIKLFGNGSATFAGTVEAGVLGATAITPLNAYNNVSDQAIPTLFLRNQNASGRLIEGRNQTGSVFYVNANGNYFFSGSGSFANAFINLEPENLSHYRTTTETYEVDGEEQTKETQEYIGPVLDVKETLVRYETTLKSVKQAVEEAEDFPTLKEALLKALTKI